MRKLPANLLARMLDIALHCVTLQCSTQIFKRIFGECNLQGAIDFAVPRMRSGGVGGVQRNAARSSAWLALHLSLTFSCGHIAAHRANS